MSAPSRIVATYYELSQLSIPPGVYSPRALVEYRKQIRVRYLNVLTLGMFDVAIKHESTIGIEYW